MAFQVQMLHSNVNADSTAALRATSEALLACRLFQAGPALPEQAALDISCIFSHPELTVVQPVVLAALQSLERKEICDPAAQGLPADLTEELTQAVCLTRVQGCLAELVPGLSSAKIQSSFPASMPTNAMIAALHRGCGSPSKQQWRERPWPSVLNCIP